MKGIFNSNKKELALGLIVCVFILNITFWLIIGFGELVHNASIGKITFYSIITIFLIFKLGNLFEMGFVDIFKNISENKIK